MKKKKKNTGASCHFLGYLSDPEIELASPAPPALAGGFFAQHRLESHCAAAVVCGTNKVT